MVVLALDTTSRQGSSAVAIDGRVVLELASDASLPQASRVPGELQTLLAVRSWPCATWMRLRWPSAPARSPAFASASPRCRAWPSMPASRSSASLRSTRWRRSPRNSGTWRRVQGARPTHRDLDRRLARGGLCGALRRRHGDRRGDRRTTSGHSGPVVRRAMGAAGSPGA